MTNGWWKTLSQSIYMELGLRVTIKTLSRSICMELGLRVTIKTLSPVVTGDFPLKRGNLMVKFVFSLIYYFHYFIFNKFQVRNYLSIGKTDCYNPSFLEILITTLVI